MFNGFLSVQALLPWNPVKLVYCLASLSCLFMFVSQINDWLIDKWHVVTCCVYRFIVLHVFLTPVPSSFVRPHAQGSIAVWDSEGLILSPLSSAIVACAYVIAGPLIVIVLQASSSWSALLSLTALVSIYYTECENLIVQSKPDHLPA